MSFKRLEADDFVISSDSITAAMWVGNVPTLTYFLLHLFKPQVVQVIIT
jgi:hypothetical protein